MSSAPEVIATWDGRAVRIVAVEPTNAPTIAAGARLLLPFTQRAAIHPDTERVLREGLSFLAEFGGGPVEDEPALLGAARRFLDRNYPVEAAA